MAGIVACILPINFTGRGLQPDESSVKRFQGSVVADARHDALKVDGILGYIWRERVIHGKQGERAPWNLRVPKQCISSLFRTIRIPE